MDYYFNFRKRPFTVIVNFGKLYKFRIFVIVCNVLILNHYVQPISLLFPKFYFYSRLMFFLLLNGLPAGFTRMLLENFSLHTSLYLLLLEIFSSSIFHTLWFSWTLFILDSIFHRFYFESRLCYFLFWVFLCFSKHLCHFSVAFIYFSSIWTIPSYFVK